MLLRAIRKVHAGELWFGRTITSGLLDRTLTDGRRRTAAKDRVPLLSARERRLITLVAEGRRNSEIARHLLTSEATVRASLTTIFRKLGVPGRFDLMMYAARYGFVGELPAIDQQRASPICRPLSLALGARPVRRPPDPTRGDGSRRSPQETAKVPS